MNKKNNQDSYEDIRKFNEFIFSDTIFSDPIFCDNLKEISPRLYKECMKSKEKLKKKEKQLTKKYKNMIK